MLLVVVVVFAMGKTLDPHQTLCVCPHIPGAAPAALLHGPPSHLSLPLSRPSHPVTQVQYSLLSSGAAQSSTKAVADDLGVVLIAYSPLALGLLTGR